MGNKVWSVLKPILKVIHTVLLAAIYLTAVCVVALTIYGKIYGAPEYGGYRLYKVLGGSMEPAIQRGSVVVIRRIDPKDLTVGDIITFKDPRDEKTMITHRIAEVNEGQSLSFITLGDANDIIDLMPVPAENVMGKVRFSVPYVGFIISFAESKAGLITLIIIPGVLILAIEAINLIKCVKTARLAKAPKAVHKEVL